MPANEIRQTRTLFEAIMPEHRAAWSKLGACEEIAEFLKRSAVLQCNTHQTGNDIVETDQLGRAVGPFETKKDFSWVFVVMDAEVERALTGNPDFLGDVIASVGEGKAGAHAATTNSSMLKAGALCVFPGVTGPVGDTKPALHLLIPDLPFQSLRSVEFIV